MPNIVDQLRSPYGLSGGTILSSSAVVTAADAFWYYMVTAVSASVTFGNLQLISGSTSQSLATLSTTFAAGTNLYGAITSVTQVNGIGILYSGSYYPGTNGR
jgi:hypothetical protein